MRTKEFLNKLEDDRIVNAIREAESKTSGEIRVYIQRLRMYKTRERNAVLIFVAPRARKFAVVGDKAIHEKCSEEFWQHIVNGMRTHFQNEKFNHALTEVIREIGKVLTAHFPSGNAGSGNRNRETLPLIP